MSTTHVLLLSVPVTDQDRARDFYVDVLGFELLRDERMGPAMRWVQVAPHGAQTSLTLPPGRFEMALQYEGDGPDPSHGFWDLRPGAYQECYFFTR